MTNLLAIGHPEPGTPTQPGTRPTVGIRSTPGDRPALTRKRRTMSILNSVRLAEQDDERGDVPGWVLITLMTAGLVIIIWGLAGPALSSVFEQAIERVTSF